ncbi:MAG: flagellar hook-associated protein FlgK [Gammaproteobacteria bacterium]|nr:flagellar hook-associated protein FlgK [Gammaproteobacteria bacterium]
MSVFINNGLSGLLAAQRALQTTANNVANAATDGYVRQRVEFSERPGSTIGGVTIGNGVQITDVRRVYDQFIADELKGATMSQSRAQFFSDLSARLDKLLGNPEQGIGQSLQAFFNQAEALNRDPTSAVNRQQLLAQGDSLGQGFAQMDTQLTRLGNEVNARLRESVNQINNIASSLAQVNGKILSNTGNVPNDLLDEQENLLNQLSELIDFNVLRQPTGAVNVLVGNGQPLVLDVNSFDLGVVANEFDGTRLELAYRGQAISNLVSGGEVAGLLAFRHESLDPARRELGQLALGLTEVFNLQHRQGMDFDGSLGGDFFAGIQATATASGTNSGTATVNVTIADAAATQAKEYILRYTGSGWEMMDAGSGAPLALSGTGTAGDPFVADGLEIVVGAGAASGDRFLVSAVSGATTAVRVAVTSPNQIAAANPVTTATSLQNLGDAGVSTANIDDVTNPNLLQAVNVVFDNATTYRIRDLGGADLTGPLAYTSGADISFNGWTVQVSGNPQANDSFNIRATGAGSGDNANALALSEISSQGFFNGGQLSLAGLGANLVSNVGSAAARAQSDLTVQTTLREQAELDLEAVAGVNLEEEAVNLLRYQEAYLAATKIITVANQLFNSLLSVVDR